MLNRAGTTLRGMKELCTFLNRSEATVLRWILQWGFPAEKNAEGVWESRKAHIEEWLRDMRDIGIMPERQEGRQKKKTKVLIDQSRW